MFELNLLLGTKGRSNKEKGSTSAALFIFTEETVIPDSDLGIGVLSLQTLLSATQSSPDGLRYPSPITHILPIINASLTVLNRRRNIPKTPTYPNLSTIMPLVAPSTPSKPYVTLGNGDMNEVALWEKDPIIRRKRFLTGL